MADEENLIGEEDDHRCVSCSDVRHGWTGLIVVGVVAIVALGVAYSLKERLARFYEVKKSSRRSSTGHLHTAAT